jgi:hypothetical protein
MNANQKSFFTGGTIILPVGATVPYNCTGQMFVCKEASDLFLMSFDDGEFFPMEVGLGFRLNGTDEFRKLSFQNNTQSIITIEFFVGVGEIQDARLNTAIQRLIIVGMMDVPDYTKGLGALGAVQHAPSSFSSGTTHVYTGTDSAHQRKQITFYNADATAFLWVGDGNNLVLAVIPPGQAWTMQSSGTFKVSGSGNVCDYLVCQTFYNS